jgi:hypothetical protein
MISRLQERMRAKVLIEVVTLSPWLMMSHRTLSGSRVSARGWVLAGREKASRSILVL